MSNSAGLRPKPRSISSRAGRIIFWEKRSILTQALTAGSLRYTYAYPLREVVFSDMVFDGSDIAPLLERWAKLLESAPRELTSFLYASARSARLFNVYASDDTEAVVDALTPLREIGPLLDQEASLAPYAAIVPPHDNDHYGGQRRPLISSGLADHLSPELSEQLALGLRTQVAPWLSIRSIGSAVNDVDRGATAYAHRHQNFNISSVGRGASKDDFLRHWDDLRPHLNGLYLSFETDQRPERLRDAFPGDTLTKLRRLKARYDPDNVFNQNFPIPPTPHDEPHEAALSAGQRFV